MRDRKITDNDRRYLLAVIALDYAKKSGFRYEIDELINEAWLSKHVRKAKTTRNLAMAGHWAMIAYMKDQQKTNRKLWHIHTRPFDRADRENIGIPPRAAEAVASTDLFVRSLWCLPPRAIQAMAMRVAGWKWHEIGKSLGYTQQGAYEMCKVALKQLREAIRCENTRSG